MGDIITWTTCVQHSGVSIGYSPALTSSRLLPTRACNLGRVDAKPIRQNTAATRGGCSLRYLHADLHLLMEIHGELFGMYGNAGGEEGMNFVVTGRASVHLSATRGCWPTLVLNFIMLIRPYTLVGYVLLSRTLLRKRSPALTSGTHP